MTPTLRILFFVFVVSLSPKSFSQHIDIDKKALSFLTSEEKINVIFTYDGLLFNEDKMPETTYIQHVLVKVKEEEGDDGAKDWLDNYNTSKRELWPEMFLTTLNEKMSEYKQQPIFEINNTQARYTMKVNTSWMYFGYNVVIGKWPSKIDVEITFYETSDPQNILTATSIKSAMGQNKETFKFDDWAKFRRVGKAYVKAAYKLAQAFKRVVD